MKLNRAALKAEARACMRESRTSPYLTALLYVVALYVINRLTRQLLFPPEYLRLMYSLEHGLVLYVSPYLYTRILYEPLAYFISFLLRVSALMLNVGMTIFCLHAARRAETSPWNLVDGFSQFLRIIWLRIVTGVFVFLWSLLLVIPGIIALYRYQLALYLLLEHPEMRVMDCIRESKRLMTGRKGELFVLDFSFFGWYLLANIPFVSVFVTPYTRTTLACYYAAVVAADESKYY